MNWNHKIRPLCILMRKTWGASCCWSRALVSKVLQVLLIIRSAANVTSSCSYSYYRKLWVNSRQIGHSSTHSRHHQPCSVCIIVIVVLRCGVELEFDFTLNFWQHQQLKQRLHLVVCMWCFNRVWQICKSTVQLRPPPRRWWSGLYMCKWIGLRGG